MTLPFRLGSQLTLEDVKQFLGAAEDEGLTWEAKAGDIKPATVQKAVAGFANSELGGVLVLGAAQDADGWRIAPFSIPGDEPGTWLSSVILRLKPVPRHRVEVRTDAAERLVLVEVETVAEPPCLTPDGRVYERVTGQTVPVVDSARIAQLFARGRAAVEHAEGAALDRAQEWRTIPIEVGRGRPVLTVVACAVGRPEDMSAALFRRSYGDRLASLLDRHLHPPSPAGTSMRALRQSSISQRHLAVSLIDPFDSATASWAAADWTGAVGAGVLDESPGGANQVDSNGTLTASLELVLTALRDLGEHGRAHVVLSLFTTKAVHVVRRWADVDAPINQLVDGIGRELRRADGDYAWEPEPIE
jgi:hypothetical protein